MSYLRGSPNYVWSTTSILGKGATATVHQGVNKSTGEAVAVKTFNQCSTLRPKEVQIREFEVLKKVKHENIVKLLAIEEEQDSRGKVIVMELCTGGSLFNILDDPENTFGLEEKEFLLVLKHVTAGMKHLRDNNLVHRDLKPGNIMKFIKEDGTTVYKLTDFGAARELQEDQQFHSLYGTEEYLHPDMYRRAVLQKPVNKAFGATIDLWSIGVTLYHVATGNLPFRPFGGRRNRETMYHITTHKESGVISGIQLRENGPIEWKRDLPSNCQLSAGLKKIITPILAGLLESDSKKIWTFDRFFTEVNSVLIRKAVNIFNANNAQLIKIYLHPDENCTYLQNYITEHTKIQPEDQILIINDVNFIQYVGEQSRSEGYPETSELNPIFLFSKEDNNVLVPQEEELPKFVGFGEAISVEKDANQAKSACSIGYLCKKRIEKHSTACKLIYDCVTNFINYINKDLKELNQTSVNLSEKSGTLKTVAQILQLSQKSFLNYNLKQNYEKFFCSLSDDFLNAIHPNVTNLYKSQAVENGLKSHWNALSRELGNPYKNLSANIAKTYVEHLRDSWQHLVRDRATRTLTYNDEQFHFLEGVKITRTINEIKSLLKTVSTQYEVLAENFGDWYKMAQNINLKTTILVADVDKFELNLRNFESDLMIEKSEFEKFAQNNLEEARKTSPKIIKASDLRNVQKKFKESRKNIILLKKAVNDNSELVNKINEFVLTLPEL